MHILDYWLKNVLLNLVNNQRLKSLLNLDNYLIKLHPFYLSFFRYQRIAAGAAVIILMIFLVLIVILTVIIYRTLVIKIENKVFLFYFFFRYQRIAAGAAVIILMIFLVLIFILAVIIYRTLVNFSEKDKWYFVTKFF